MRLSHKYKIRSKKRGVTKISLARIVGGDFFNMDINVYKSHLKPRSKKVKSILKISR